MNLRIGRFGRQESASAVLIATFFGCCFGTDSRMLCEHGNASYLVQILASIQALLLFEAVVWALRVRGGFDLSALIGRSRLKAVFVVPLVLALVLAAIRPLGQFLITITQYVFPDAKQVTVCLYLLPCLLLLTALGAETLLRTSRLLLPLLLLSVVGALLLGVGQYRTDRLFPIPLKDPMRIFSLSGSVQFSAIPPLLALLILGEGTQDRMAMRSAGRIGAIGGGLLASGAFFALAQSFTYVRLRELTTPFYDMLLAVRTVNPTLRIDRAVLFLWLTGAILTAAFYLYAASVLLCKTFGMRDVRPASFCISAIAVTLMLVLYYDTAATEAVRIAIARYGWALLSAPVPVLLLKKKRRKGKCAASA
ncbi:MAG: GerAB/ArcD/ProY family transporter [Clostridia bacterium]|nr:GerAB/ArcD/ProY family transporter [Clostridia bacterium]